ncbi:MAG TPA: ATPase, T2SS/T4P/T4SS family [Polyangiaceae bacterium]|jgi:type II secretory ATPase GspE/PulE/Tfp pilus assembly ATPase PilB-like protein|nr:ATPase, T2SS/T4P/T4SS family [Polyangiaceae bacterium]
MSSDRTFTPNLASVTIGLVDGQVKQGFIARFSPSAPDLVMSAAPDGGGKLSVASERVAYVAFHRAANASNKPQAPPHNALRVHVAANLSFLVEVQARSEGPLGFYSTPAEANSPYYEIFFYQHGVRRRELNEPLGSMLVREGQVGASALKQGLDAQRGQERTPIGQILVEHRKLDRDALEQAVALQRRKGTRLGEVLVEAGLATPQDIDFALAEQRKRGGKRIGQILVEMKLVSEAALSMTLAKKFQLPFVDLDSCAINLAAVTELPRAFIEKNRVLPVDTDAGRLTVAISDPLAIDVIDATRQQAGKHVSEVVATPSQLDRYIPSYLDQLEATKVATEMDVIIRGLASDDVQTLSEAEATELAVVKESDNSIIKLANQIIIDAYRRGASDIHIEPNGKERTLSVRFRVDGDCVAYQEIPPPYRLPLVARFKIMAQLDISERRKPQDGKIRFRVGDKQIELRVATIPTVNNNEDIVLRILAASKPLPLEALGLSLPNLKGLEAVVKKPYGLILCVGPTGSGKTTTLHSALGHINTIDTKIWTAEDPVEITQAGLRQVQVNAKIGFTFAAAMRAFLRADPDVIMVGEMRDVETASTAVEASLTGHLVLSTLHTNSAPETITRLVDMGLDPFSFADALLGVLAQRLARTLCKQCRELYTPDAHELAELALAYGPRLGELIERDHPYGVKLWRARGCNACSDTGYRGRIALHELLIGDDAIKLSIQKKSPVHEIRTLAVQAGMTTLLQDGIEKVLAGHTDLKQVLAVCSR